MLKKLIPVAFRACVVALLSFALAAGLHVNADPWVIIGLIGLFILLVLWVLEASNALN